MSITTTAVAQSIIDDLVSLVDDAAVFLRDTPYDKRAHGMLVSFDRESQEPSYCALGYCGKKRGMSDEDMDAWFGAGYAALFFADHLDQLSFAEAQDVKVIMHSIFNASDSGAHDPSEIARFRLTCYDFVDRIRKQLRARGVQVS